MARNEKQQGGAAKALSRQTLDLVPGRGLAFLEGVGTSRSIFTALVKVGFTNADLDEGWALLRRACTTVSGPSTAPPSPHADALVEVEAWWRAASVRARAALRRMHPEQEAFLFAGLDATRGAEAALATSIFLDRCIALERGKKGRARHDEGVAALATLEKREITKAERTRVEGLVKAVFSPPLTAEPEDVAGMRAARLAELHAWLQDWSSSARTVITRRDELIRLGLGKRRRAAS
jgi:hypothetical protein